MYNNKYLDQEWYSFLKKKYKLTDDDMEEYIDSFELINKGEIITPNILYNFINDELNEKWTFAECQNIINQINLKINNKYHKILDVKTYLQYIIPICQYYGLVRISIKELFDSMDENRDGKITCNELISILYKINKNLTPKEIFIYKQQILRLCKDVDTNNDGFISYNEFKLFMIEKHMSVK